MEETDFQKRKSKSTSFIPFFIDFRFTAENSYFPSGELQLICQAEIEGVWKTHAEEIATGGGSGKKRRPKANLAGKGDGTVRRKNLATSHYSRDDAAAGQVMDDEEYDDADGWGAHDAAESSQPNHLLVRNRAGSIGRRTRGVYPTIFTSLLLYCRSTTNLLNFLHT